MFSAMDIFGFNLEFNSKMDSFAGDKSLYDIEANELKEFWDSDLETVRNFFLQSDLRGKRWRGAGFEEIVGGHFESVATFCSAW